MIPNVLPDGPVNFVSITGACVAVAWLACAAFLDLSAWVAVPMAMVGLACAGIGVHSGLWARRNRGESDA